MTLREFIISRLQLFCFLVTMILVTSAVLGAVIAPEKELRYYHLFSPVIIAAACVLPTIITYFRKEPTIPEYIIRLIAELSVIEVLVLIMVSPPADVDIVYFRIMLGISVFVIYVLATIMMLYQRYLQSKKFTRQLRHLQKSE